METHTRTQKQGVALIRSLNRLFSRLKSSELSDYAMLFDLKIPRQFNWFVIEMYKYRPKMVRFQTRLILRLSIEHLEWQVLALWSSIEWNEPANLILILGLVIGEKCVSQNRSARAFQINVTMWKVVHWAMSNQMRLGFILGKRSIFSLQPEALFRENGNLLVKDRTALVWTFDSVRPFFESG